MVNKLISFPNIILIKLDSNKGFTGGNNVGMQFALEHHYEYIMMLNNDVLVDAHFLIPLISKMEEDKTIGAVQPLIYFHHDTNLIWNAGSVFIGNYSPESVGDYASGTNHTLPTNGYAKAYSGVSVDSFVKKITLQAISKEGLQNLGETIITMANAESLQAHANAVSIRLK